MFRILLGFIFLISAWSPLTAQIEPDTTVADVTMPVNPEARPEAGPLLSASQLERKKWFYSIDEAMRDPNNVYKLSLQDTDLKFFPMEVKRFPNLQVLNLSNNKIKTVPVEIAELGNLQVLILANNKLRALPDEMKELANLQSLYLGRNRFIQIPAWVGGLSKLRHMDLSYNNLTSYEVDLVRQRLPRCEVTH